MDGAHLGQLLRQLRHLRFLRLRLVELEGTEGAGAGEVAGLGARRP